MPNAPTKDDKAATTTVDAVGDTATRARQRMGVCFASVNNADQSIVANYAMVNVEQGMAFTKFGFLESGMRAAIPRVAKQGGMLPQAVNGKLAVRMAIGFDGLAGLHRQLENTLFRLQPNTAAREKVKVCRAMVNALDHDRRAPID